MKAYTLMPLWARMVFARAGKIDRALLMIAMVFTIAVIGPYLGGVPSSGPPSPMRWRWSFPWWRRF